MDEPEWRDANPETADLPNKGRTAIALIFGGLILAVLSFLSRFLRPVGLGAGAIAFFYGIGIFIRKQKNRYKQGVVLIIAGFLLLLSNPRTGIGPVAGIAGTVLFIGALVLVVLGIFKAIEISWKLGKKP